MKSLYLNLPMSIIFDDYTHYSKFCKYTEDVINNIGYVPLRYILKFINQDFDFDNNYGYTKKTVNEVLVKAELHKFKRKYKTDGTWPICITFPTPINILKE